MAKEVKEEKKDKKLTKKKKVIIVGAGAAAGAGIGAGVTYGVLNSKYDKDGNPKPKKKGKKINSKASDLDIHEALEKGAKKLKGIKFKKF